MADSNTLVQRGGLDLLLTHFKLDLCVKCMNPDPLVSATLKVLLRRDMSLNRRIYAWLDGSSEEILRRVLEIEMKGDGPMILVYLLDTTHGPFLFKSLFLCLIRASMSSVDEARDGFRMILTQIDPVILWKNLIDLLEACEVYHN